MYSKQQASAIKQKFWTSFGQYMRPVKNANDETINWINYHTGIKHIYFRMDADNKQTTIAIELHHPDTMMRQQYFEQFKQLRTLLEEETGEQWQWDEQYQDEHHNPVSRISTTLTGTNIFNEADWPAIISFLKPRIIALDSFWEMVKDRFE